jgi:hypothetical protein
VALCAAAFGAWLWLHDSKVADQAERKVIERSAEHGKEAGAAAAKAHAEARKPGAPERVRAKYCRDCDPGPSARAGKP